MRLINVSAQAAGQASALRLNLPVWRGMAVRGADVECLWAGVPFRYAEEGVQISSWSRGRHPVSSRVSFMAWAGWRLARACRSGHCSVSAADPVGWVTTVAASALARPVVAPRICIEVHGDFLNTARSEGTWLRRAVLRQVLLAVVRRADVVRVVHEQQAAALRALVPRASVQVVPPRVHPDIETVLSDETVERRAWPPTEVLGVGSHLPVKGWDLLLQALCENRFAHLRLCLVGDGPLRAELEGLVAQLGIAGRVDFVGFQQPDAVAERLVAAHLVVVPSRHEGLPRTVIEALCAGVPVLATPVGGLPALAHRFNGLVLTREISAASLAEGLDRLLERSDVAAAAWDERRAAGALFGYGAGLDRLYRVLTASEPQL